MTKNHIQIIKTGGDPSRYNEFEVIKSEINKMSHPKQPTVDWALIDNNALILFEKNGIDLLSISYYTLARYHRYGLTGFVEGCELLSALICHQWDTLWPTQTISRVDALDWFNTRIGSQIRKQTFTIKDIPLLQRASDALEKVTDKIQQVSLKKLPRIENLFYFVQNNVEILERNLATLSKQNQKEKPRTTLVYLPEASYDEQLNKEYVTQDVMEEEQSIDITSNISGRYNKRTFSLWSFGLGILLSAVASYGVMTYIDSKHDQILSVMGPNLSWFNKKVVKQPDISLINNKETRLSVFLNYKIQLHDISSLSPIAPYYYADNLLENMKRLWPEEQEYKQLLDYWQNEVQMKTSYPVKISSYYTIKTQLQVLKTEVDNAISQNRYITIAYLRNTLDSMQKELDSQLPAEELLRQMETYHQTGKEIPIELKQSFNQQLQMMMARYYQIDKLNR